MEVFQKCWLSHNVVIVAGEVKDIPVALHVPVLYPCTTSEQLRITIDAQRGMLQAALPSVGQYAGLGV
ncbi:hypothetical protein DPMN_128424 [Dreissena polymorpha]|uniref:Mediator of RNA polymerase II transcription subunit 14 RM3 domain-containing protein n=1 Tax=Dreissena polymorpha TaxID=45954 RepID=A0A9D4K046_DREPO|nr:hypothetical protein DPMN_128424 [Dreissena polymorpha]